MTNKGYRLSFDSGITSQEDEKSKRSGPVDIESAIECTGYGKFNYYLLLVSVFVSSSASMVTMAISMVVPVIGCDFNTTNFEKGLLQQAVFGGMIFAAFFWGAASDCFGRKNLIVYGYILDGFIGIAFSLAPSLWPMLVLKTLNGALSCGPFTIFSTYLSEVYPKAQRDMAVLLMGLFNSIAIVLQPAIALLTMWYFPMNPTPIIFGDYKFASWRIFLFTCSLPSLIAGLLMIFVPESPKFLVEKGRLVEALHSLRKIYAMNSGLDKDTFSVYRLKELRSPSVIALEKSGPKMTFWKNVKVGLALSLNIFQKPYVGRVLYYFVIQFGCMAGSNGIRLWLPQMFTSAESSSGSDDTDGGGFCDLITASSNAPPSADCVISSPTTFTNMLIINAGLLISFPVFIIGAKFVNKKVPIVMSSIVPSFFIFAIPLVPKRFVVYISSILLSIIAVSFFALLSSVVQAFPTNVRATSVSMTQTIGRLGIMFANSVMSIFVFDYCSTVIYGLGFVTFVAGVTAIALPSAPIVLEQEERNSAAKRANVE